LYFVCPSFQLWRLLQRLLPAHIGVASIFACLSLNQQPAGYSGHHQTARLCVQWMGLLGEAWGSLLWYGLPQPSAAGVPAINVCGRAVLRPPRPVRFMALCAKGIDWYATVAASAMGPPSIAAVSVARHWEGCG
jgi:hypothetical protein